MTDFMYEQEKKRLTHLVILLCCTVFIFLLAVQAVLYKWEMSAVVLLFLGIGICWAVHVADELPDRIRTWMYFIVTMLGYFFYGLHETSIEHLASVMVLIILIYAVAESNTLINLCVLICYLTLGYDYIFVADGPVEITSGFISRTLFQIALVFMAGCLTKFLFKSYRKEREVLEERIRELEEINGRTEDFMANVSHELRTPINVVTGLTAVMLKNEEDAGKRKNIRSIQLAGHRLFNQIEDILDYTEIDTGRLRVSEDTYIISSVIHDVISGRYLPEYEQELELIFDIDAGVPAVLFGDGRKIKKIIQHLVDNAVKFTQKGGVYVRIYSVRKTYGVNLCISVSDTGTGIDEEHLEKITEKFFQINEGRNRSSGGLGLGLTIVNGMVSALEGFLQVESEKGAGTVVSVSIPQKVADESPCMTVDDRTGLCVACYLKLEEFDVPEVRHYYNEMIFHMVKGLGVPLHRLSDIGELSALMSRCQLTHLIITQKGYEENPSYFEALDKDTAVIVAADAGFTPPSGSRIEVLRKPVYGWSIVHKLNDRQRKGVNPFVQKRMVCPGVSVLIVDDEPMNLMVAEGLFQDYQMNVKTAHSGIEAIELCREEAFDLIFLDHMMPEMDGVETLKHLRRIHADTDNVHAVIAFTANASSSAREMLLREGFHAFVSKPVENSELERVLRDVLPKSAIRYLEDDTPRPEYSGTKQSPEEWRTVELESIGVHTQSGMRYCGGDPEFYEELLVKFARNEERKGSEISDCFRREEFGKYRILVHALKSSAKMVGADFLSELARQAEDAAKNNDTDYIKAHHGELLGQYRELAQGVLQVFGENGSARTAQSSGTELTKDELVQGLRRLTEALGTFEAERSEALISGMSGAVYRGTSVDELLAGVRRDVDEFEFADASEKVGTLLQKIEGSERL